MGVPTPSCTGKSGFSWSLSNKCDGLTRFCLFLSLFHSFPVLNLARVCKNSILLINMIFFLLLLGCSLMSLCSPLCYFCFRFTVYSVILTACSSSWVFIDFSLVLFLVRNLSSQT